MAVHRPRRAVRKERALFHGWSSVIEAQYTSQPMTTIEEAVEIALEWSRSVFASTSSRRESIVAVDERCIGRVLAKDVKAHVPHPPFAASVMDGYAVNARETIEQTGEQNIEFTVLASEVSRAGPVSTGRLKRAMKALECAYVTTGAALPRGCDCVIPSEQCDVHSNGTVVFVERAALVAGKWTRVSGSDVAGQGETLVRRGEQLTVFDIGVLKYAVDEIAIFNRPRVRILSTGDELVASVRDVHDKFGCIVDTNSPMLGAMCMDSGSEVICRDVTQDDLERTTTFFRSALADEGCDALITSGGASVGDRDFIEAVITSLGGEIHFRRLAMKPGKPTTFATLSRSDGLPPLLVFALPGNPVSAAVTFSLIVAPCIQVLSGSISEPKLRRIHCVLNETLTLDPERPEYHRAVLEWNGATHPSLPIAHSTGRQISSRLLSMRGADVLVELPKGPGVVEKGAIASALVLSDFRRANFHMEKIATPKRDVGHAPFATFTTRNDARVYVLGANGRVLDLKRSVGLEENVRSSCRRSGSSNDVADVLSAPLSMYSNNEIHVAVTDDLPSQALFESIEKTAKRLRIAMSNTSITHRTFARVGLAGNPSDAYGGKVVAASISNFCAEAILTPMVASKRVSFVLGPYDANDYDSFDDMASHVSSHGVDGGVRLLKALCENVKRYCVETKQMIDFSCGFELSYASTIPEQLGLSGSSGIIIAALRCLMQHYGVKMSIDEQASIALRVEHDVGINAGPMDRVQQVYGGCMFMDFSCPKECDSSTLIVHGEYTRLNADLLPPMYLVWRGESASHSGKVHSGLKERWTNRHTNEDSEVAVSMGRLASLAEEIFELFKKGKKIDVNELADRMNENFQLRRTLMGDKVISEANLRMVRMCQEVGGGGAKLAGSGGSCVAVCKNEATAQALRRACTESGYAYEQLKFV